jgi:hypothetical protein
MGKSNWSSFIQNNAHTSGFFGKIMDASLFRLFVPVSHNKPHGAF